MYNKEKNTLEVIPGVIAALDPAVTKWLVVEQDNSDTPHVGMRGEELPVSGG